MTLKTIDQSITRAIPSPFVRILDLRTIFGQYASVFAAECLKQGYSKSQPYVFHSTQRVSFCLQRRVHLVEPAGRGGRAAG